MKVLILLADNVYLTPYLKFYTSLLDECNIKYDIIFWDKNDNEKTTKDNYFRFHYKASNKFKKIFGYIKYKKYIKKIEKKEKYDIVITLHTIVAFLIYKTLLKKYKKKYIYDVRDYSYENILIYKYIQKKIVKNSMINIISSNGYKTFLPKGYDYYVTHNIPVGDYSNYKQMQNSNKDTIEISYIGLIRFMEQNKKIISFFKNDKRFHINFIGTNATELKKFCDDNSIKNITLIDTFEPELTMDFYKTTDIIMNLYGNKSRLLDYAISNKLYYSAILYKPILVCKDTYMEKTTQKYKIGFTLNLNSETEKDELYKYIKELNREEYIKNCDKFMEHVYKEQQILNKKLIKVLKNKENFR